MVWAVPREWRGDATAFLLAGGPSLRSSGLFDPGILDRLKALQDQRRALVIAINRSFEVAPWSEVLFSGDSRFYNAYRKRLRAFVGRHMVAAANDLPTKKWPNVKKLRWHHPKTGGVQWIPPFVSDNPSRLAGECSGGLAIDYAVHAGVGRIAGGGYDFQHSDSGEDHWHDGHRTDDGQEIKSKTPRWKSHFIPAIERKRADLERLGVVFINCNPDSALRCYPFGNLVAEIERLEKGAA